MTMWPQRRDMSPFQDELEKRSMWRTRKQRITRMQGQKGMQNNSHCHIGIPEQECYYFQTRNKSEIALRNALSRNMLRLYTWGYKGEYTQRTSKDRKIYYNTIRKSKKIMRKSTRESHHNSLSYGIDKNQRVNKEDDKSLPNMNEEFAETITASNEHNATP